jgi:hypothetical protein
MQNFGTVEEILATGKLLLTLKTAIKKSKDQLIHMAWAASVHKRHRLHTCDFKALAAAQVLAHDQIVAPHHVRACFGEFGAVAFVSPGRELSLFGAHQPCQLVFIGLLAVRAVQRVGLPGFFLIEEIALVHGIHDNHRGHRGTQRIYVGMRTKTFPYLLRAPLWPLWLN